MASSGIKETKEKEIIGDQLRQDALKIRVPWKIVLNQAKQKLGGSGQRMGFSPKFLFLFF
jgi:hypothetical protein